MDELSYWLALWRINGIGSSHFQKIIEQFQQLDAFFAQSVAQLRALGLTQEQSEQISGFYQQANTPV